MKQAIEGLFSTALNPARFVEHRPRRLLQAAAAGIPVIASKACGVRNVNGIETIDIGDIDGLEAAIERRLMATG